MLSRKLLILLTGIIMLLSYKVLFSTTSMSAGDAPYLTPGLMKSYLSEPVAWTTVGTTLGGVNQFLWIWPYMTVISAVGSALGLSSALLMRIFFYIPAILLSITGSYYFTKRYSNSFLVCVISTLVYSVNTYFLLVVDGGQVGIALAYGLFPWVLNALAALTTKLTITSFFAALISLELLTLADPRITLIALMLSVILFGRKIKNVLVTAPILIGINLYWLYPMLQSAGSGVVGSVGQFTSFLNGLFLYAPHWSQNIFGVVTYPTIFFLLFPVFILISIQNKENKKSLLGAWLLFVFLVKGTTPPLGSLYELGTSLPFGAAFRDSTKFMIPLLLISGVLIGQGVEVLEKKVKFASLIFIALFTVALYPALSGQLSFVLSGNETNSESLSINEEISSGKRAVWINERDPRAETGSVESINGFDLTSLRPFAQLNVGDSDKFNFFNASESAQWLDVFGINHIVLSGNPRKIALSQKEIDEWNRTKNLISNQTHLNQTDEPSVYENKDAFPIMYSVDKMLFVVGSDSIYKKVNARVPNAIPQKAAVAFLEDGKFDADFTESYASTSAVFVNNGGGEAALTMSMLKKHFKGVDKASQSQFAKYSSDNYLKYKYELLIRDFIFEDFDYGQGIAFSTQKDEELVFDFNVPEGEYVLAVRALSKGNSQGHITFGQFEKDIPISSSFAWVTENVRVDRNNQKLTIKNNDTLTVFNVAALIPKAEYVKAQSKTRDLITLHGMYTPEMLPGDLFKSHTLVNAKEAGTTRYIIEKPLTGNWLILNYQYSPLFRYAKDQISYKSIPVYSSLNAFYLRPEWSTAVLSYTGQSTVRWGLYYSLIALLISSIVIIYKLINEK